MHNYTICRMRAVILQGHALRQLGLTFRPDWEHPTRQVLDWLVSSRPDVDASKLILAGTSFSGLLCARAAAFEGHRLAGVVLNPVGISPFPRV